MMNIIDMQNNLKGLTDEQLVGEMQQPTGQVPQYLVLAELTRRKDMRDEFAKRQADSGKTVAENAIAAAGFPQGGIASLSSMAPRTDLSMNDAAPMMGQPPQPAPPPPMAEVRGMADGHATRWNVWWCRAACPVLWQELRHSAKRQSH